MCTERFAESAEPRQSSQKGLTTTLWHHQMTFSESAQEQRERGFKEDRRGIEVTVPTKQQNKERWDWQDSKSETGPDDQLRQKNKGKGVCNIDMIL